MKVSRNLRKHSIFKQGQRRWFDIESLENRTLLSTYYVSTGGSDSAAGTSSAPWKTLQHAVSMVQAGDTVDVRAGNYAGFVLGWNGSQNGTASAPITFKAESGVVINATNNKTRDGIDAENCSYIVIDGFTIQPPSGDAAWRSGIRFGGGGTGNVVENCHVFMRTGDTMGIFSSFNTNQVVQNNEVSGNDDAGIYCSNSAVNPTVRNNYVHDLSTSTGQAVGIHFNGDVSQGGTGIINGGLVEGNKVYNCGTGISMDGMQNATVQNNLLLDIHGKGINLYQQDASAGSKNDVVVNNTVVLASDGYFPIGVRYGSTNVKVLNNIGIGGSRAFVTDSASKSGLVVDYNIWSVNAFSNDNDSSWMKFPNWQSTGQDAHTVLSTASALFMNPNSDYHLLSTAPAVDAGTSTSAPTTDYDGNARPAGSGYDIGAFEYGSSGSSVTVPEDPSGLSATANSSSQVALTWNDNSSNETGFKIERKTGSGSYSQIATVGENVTSYSDTTASGSTQYAYRVCATNAVGDSGYATSSAVTTPAAPVTPTTPNAPSALGATAAAYNQVNLSWTDNSSDESGFKIERKTGSGSYSQIATVGANVTSYSDTTASGSTQYAYRVCATNAVGDSGYATSSAVTTPAAPVTPTTPNAPSALGATAAAYNQVNLSWTDNSSDESGFKIERKTGSGSYSQIATVGANVTSYSDTTASGSTQYTYRVCADECGGRFGLCHIIGCDDADGSGHTDNTECSQRTWCDGNGQ